MKSSSITRPTCRLCHSDRLTLALPLAATPIGDNYLSGEQLGQPEETFNLDLYLCTECGQVQLRDVVSPDLLYPDFPYVTSVSVGLPEHFRRFAADVMTQHEVPAGSFVVEIGSNEGPMLRAFQERGCRVLGVEPAGEIARAATAAGVPTLADYFTGRLGRELRDKHGAAQVIAANNVLANIDDLDDVFKGFTSLLADDGLVVMETSYWGDVVAKGLIDTIYHEHISYFSVTPLVRFFARHGLEVIDAYRHANKGGSIRLTAQRTGGQRAVRPSVAEFIARERTEKIHDPATARACRQRLDRLREELQRHATTAIAAGRKLAGYGASVGTTTMLYEFGLAPHISAIFDDNPRKHGRFSPGHHLPCVPADQLKESHPDQIVLFAWRYLDQIRDRHAEALAGEDRIILSLPEYKVV